MSRPNPMLLGAVLMAILIALIGASLAKGGFFLGKHEGDTLHLLQMVLRMGQGDWPHLDFQTPIGVLAMAPISLMIRLGAGAGHAILLGQALVALLALPAIWWVSASRFRGVWAYVFGGFVLVLILALVHGEAGRAVSISMHYNRWAWAYAFLAIATAMLPADEDMQRPGIDGLVIGLALAALALTKVTYFAAFLPAIAVALIARRAWRTVGVTLLTGLAVAALVTLVAGGFTFWLAYLRDLATVAASEVRPQPGLPFPAVVGAPAYMGGSLVLVTSIIFLRQAHYSVEGLMMLFLMPAFFYVTYQNFGNDPQWMGLVALILVTLRPTREVYNGLGWDLRTGIGVLATAAFAFAAPSAINLAYSPFRHLTEDADKYTALLPGSGVHEDVRTAKLRALRVDGKWALDLEGSPFAAFADPEQREDVTEWRGETLPTCSIELGMTAWFATLAADLNEAGVAEGKTAFVADILSSFWLFGAFEPLPGSSPWHYGGLPGIDNADYLLVPLCPLSTEVRKMILEAVDEAEVALTEVRRNELYVLYTRDE